MTDILLYSIAALHFGALVWALTCGHSNEAVDESEMYAPVRPPERLRPP